MPCTRMTTLIFIFSDIFPLDGLSYSMPSVLNTIRSFFMRLYSSVEEIVTVCHV